MGLLRGKRAFITGGSTGIGRATAERFAAEGADVAILARERSRPAQQEDGPIRVIQGDVREPQEVASAMHTAFGRDGPDVCVANAGVFEEFDSFLDADTAIWNSVISVNLLGVLITFQTAARRMVQQGHGGRLLATSSIAGLRAEERSPAYGASKAGVGAIVQALALELAPYEITVNAIAPGQIDTDLNKRNMGRLGERRGQTLEEVRTAWLHNIPISRLGTSREVAALFAFLASAESQFITGEVIRLDGGELLKRNLAFSDARSTSPVAKPGPTWSQE